MTALTPEAVLPIEDWQWLADQLRAWPERRVHPERTMCEGVLRPMAADVIEAALATAARVAELEEALRPFAEQPTIQERVTGPDVSEWGDASVERRIEMMGERKREHDANILKARALLTKGGQHGW